MVAIYILSDIIWRVMVVDNAALYKEFIAQELLGTSSEVAVFRRHAAVVPNTMEREWLLRNIRMEEYKG